MTKIIPLRDANQSIVEWIREMEAGEDIVITRDGAPIARLSPVAGTPPVPNPAREAAWDHFRAAMERGWDIGAGPLDRDELYERFDRDALHER